MNSIKCIVADDNSSDRFLYAKMVSDMGHEVLGLAGDGRELITKTIELKPEFILTDITMPNLNGIEASHHIKENISRDINIICITGDDILPNAFTIAKSHINGYLLKGFPAINLKTAMEASFKGRFYIDNRLHKKIARLFDYDEIPLLADNLKETDSYVEIEHGGKKVKISDRQVLIVSAMFDSKRKEEIAKMLSIEPQSVAQNIKRLKIKLNANDRMELIRIFIEYGLIDNVQLINTSSYLNDITNYSSSSDE